MLDASMDAANKVLANLNKIESSNLLVRPLFQVRPHSRSLDLLLARWYTIGC